MGMEMRGGEWESGDGEESEGEKIPRRRNS